MLGLQSRGNAAALFLQSLPPAERPMAITKFAVEVGGGAGCPCYFSSLAGATRDNPLPVQTDLYADLYRTASADRQWIALSIVFALERAALRSQEFFEAADNADCHQDRMTLDRCGSRALRRSEALLKLLDVTVPNELSPSFRTELESIASAPAGKRLEEKGQPAADRGPARFPRLFVELNICELHTALQHIMRHEALSSHLSRQAVARAEAISQEILLSALQNIHDTALTIEEFAEIIPTKDFQRMLCQGMSHVWSATSEEAIENSYLRRFGAYP